MRQNLNLKNITRDLSLLLASPKDYIFSYSAPRDKIVHFERFDPKAWQVGRNIVSQINRIAPGLKVYFVGSVSLKISGANDIDLISQCDKYELVKYAKLLESLLGMPVKRNRGYTIWKTCIKGYSVELLLSDPNQRFFKEMLKTYLFLKKNKNVLKEYEELKIKSSGVCEREYIRRRMVFFNKYKLNL